jgi:hypothetical protein
MTECSREDDLCGSKSFAQAVIEVVGAREDGEIIYRRTKLEERGDTPVQQPVHPTNSRDRGRSDMTHSTTPYLRRDLENLRSGAVSPVISRRC